MIAATVQTTMIAKRRVRLPMACYSPLLLHDFFRSRKTVAVSPERSRRMACDITAALRGDQPSAAKALACAIPVVALDPALELEPCIDPRRPRRCVQARSGREMEKKPISCSNRPRAFGPTPEIALQVSVAPAPRAARSSRSARLPSTSAAAAGAPVSGLACPCTGASRLSMPVLSAGTASASTGFFRRRCLTSTLPRLLAPRVQAAAPRSRRCA